MHILIIEDASRFAETLENSLKELSHTIKRAIDASRASGFLEEEEFDCLIVDMNMRTTGLVSEQTKKTGNGLGTGWIWLKEQVFPIYPEYEKRTIICSAYESEIKDKLPQEYELIKQRGIPFIPKEQGIDTIIAMVEKIYNQIIK